MLDAVAVAQNNKRLGPGSSASGLLTDPKPIPKTNSQTLNLDVPAITNLNLIPSVPVLPRPPYRFHPGVYTRAQCHTLRLKLIKIGAVIVRNTRTIHFHLSESYPWASLFNHAARRLVPT